jgi:glycosyltransferase involved in cell wall biosynthesis
MPKAKITASLTTMKEREESLKDTVKSLLPQVDKLNVYLHGYNEKPQFLNHKKIEVAFSLEHGDHGDIDKMAWVDEVKGYHLVCDDDLIYPPDYAKSMVKAINEYDKKVIVSYHGSVLKRLPIAKYYSDRLVFPCLGEVKYNQRVSVIGTGTLGYHSSVGLGKIDLKDKMPNMLDIHLSMWARQNNIPLFVLAHKEGWIRHSEKVDLNRTIYAAQVNADFIQTQIINDHPELFGGSQELIPGIPIVSIVVINSRGLKAPEMLKECFDSIREQSYPNIEPVVVTNFDKLMTIGKAFNDGVRKASGEWILFLGDDDRIAPDYVSSLITFASGIGDPKMAYVSTFLTMFNGMGKAEPRELVPTGMWKKEYLLENPFKEYLTRYVDTEIMERVEKSPDHNSYLMRWHYGYFYRSHSEQVSGHKSMGMYDRSASVRTDTIKEKLRKIQ